MKTRIVSFLFAVLAAFLLSSCAILENRAPKAVTPGVYTIHRIAPQDAPAHDTPWDDPLWEPAEELFLSNAMPQSKYKGVRVYGKLLHDGKKIYAIFKATDRYVQAASIHPNSFTCLDTCVEFFVAPGQKQGGYFNLEVSLDGVALAQYHMNQAKPFDDVFGFVSEEDYKRIRTDASANRVVLPELKGKTEWWIFFSLDADIPIRYSDAQVPAELSGQTWNANFYHCAEASSHPRWITWNPISKLNFHLPECFGKIYFE